MIFLSGVAQGVGRGPIISQGGLAQRPGGLQVLERRQIAAIHLLSRMDDTLQLSLAVAAAYQMVMEQLSG